MRRHFKRLLGWRLVPNLFVAPCTGTLPSKILTLIIYLDRERLKVRLFTSTRHSVPARPSVAGLRNSVFASQSLEFKKLDHLRPFVHANSFFRFLNCGVALVFNKEPLPSKFLSVFFATL